MFVRRAWLTEGIRMYGKVVLIGVHARINSDTNKKQYFADLVADLPGSITPGIFVAILTKSLQFNPELLEVRSYQHGCIFFSYPTDTDDPNAIIKHWQQTLIEGVIKRHR